MSHQGTPRRLADKERVRDLVAGHLDGMVEFVEHMNGASQDGNPAGARKVMKCAVIVQWQDPDGSEYVTVAGDADLETLALKGILHDGLYALAHEGEPGFKSLGYVADDSRR